jgi:hypothetical protein
MAHIILMKHSKEYLHCNIELLQTISKVEWHVITFGIGNYDKKILSHLWNSQNRWVLALDL